MKRIQILVLLAAITGLVFSGTAVADVQKFSRELTHILRSSPVEEKHSMIVHLTDQVDLISLDAQLYHQKVSRATRHRIVIEELRAAAARSQGAIREVLDELAASGEVEGYTAYWIVNCFVFYGSGRAAALLAERDDVDYLELNFEPELIKPVPSGRQHLDDDEDTPPAGIVAVRAPEVWYELGINGSGALVGGLDTGVDGAHPALDYRWRGNFAPASHCWRSPVNGSLVPVDLDGHGTHTMGTMCGATVAAGSGDTVGVAPASLWIADDAIDQGVGRTFDNDALDAFQWFADPDGNPETVEDVPDVVQNSWGVDHRFTAYRDCDDRWDAAILALEAGGTVASFSAGNEGPKAQTHRSPANAIYDSVSFFSVGAVNATDYDWPYPIAGFSSRGPSDCDSFTIKPEVVAPGVSVYSSIPGGGYEQENWDGTSMAGPHVAGIVALMRSADPNIDVRDIKSIIMRTARDLGTPGEDNTFGWGFVDAYEAVLQVLAGRGLIMGIVRDAGTLDPIQALVEVVGGSQQMTASSTGAYTLVLPGDSSYTVRYSLYGYVTREQTLYVPANDTTFQDVNLEPREVATLFSDDFEGGGPGWTHSSPPSWGDQWHISSEQAHSGSYSYKCGYTGVGDYDNFLDAQLFSPVVPDLPEEARLFFWMQIFAEVSPIYGQDSCYDGGNLSISVDGGPFELLTPVTTLYNSHIRSGSYNNGPFDNRTPVWSDTIEPWAQVAVPLDAYAGADIQLRWRFGSDAGITNEGWYVDDVLIVALDTSSVNRVTGLVILVEGDDLHLSWDPDDNYGYRIYSDDDPEGDFATTVGETTDTEWIIIGGATAAEMKFYVVRGWDGASRRPASTN